MLAYEKEKKDQKPILVRGTNTLVSPVGLALHSNDQVFVSNVVKTVSSGAKNTPSIDFVKPYFMSDQPSTEPEIVRVKHKWYVKFYYQNPFNKDQWHRFHYYGELNNNRYINNREFNANYLSSQLLTKLKQGKIPDQYKGVQKHFIREETRMLSLL